VLNVLKNIWAGIVLVVYGIFALLWFFDSDAPAGNPSPDRKKKTASDDPAAADHKAG
jgi:hypothetical protein